MCVWKIIRLCQIIGKKSESTFQKHFKKGFVCIFNVSFQTHKQKNLENIMLRQTGRVALSAKKEGGS